MVVLEWYIHAHPLSLRPNKWIRRASAHDYGGTWVVHPCSPSEPPTKQVDQEGISTRLWSYLSGTSMLTLWASDQTSGSGGHQHKIMVVLKWYIHAHPLSLRPNKWIRRASAQDYGRTWVVHPCSPSEPPTKQVDQEGISTRLWWYLSGTSMLTLWASDQTSGSGGHQHTIMVVLEWYIHAHPLSLRPNKWIRRASATWPTLFDEVIFVHYSGTSLGRPPLLHEKSALSRGVASCQGLLMLRFTLPSGLSRGVGLLSGWPLKRGSTVLWKLSFLRKWTVANINITIVWVWQ